MARSKKDEAPAEETQNTPAEETQNSEDQAPDESAEVETAPGEPGDVIDARLQKQEQGDDTVADDEAGPGVDEEFDKDAEGQAQHENVVMAPSGLASGPTQDELNPAYSAPTKQ